MDLINLMKQLKKAKKVCLITLSYELRLEVTTVKQNTFTSVFVSHVSTVYF